MNSRASLFAGAGLFVTTALTGVLWLSGQQSHEVDDKPVAGGEGARRNQALRNLTEVYVVRGEEVSQGMRVGVELAPTSFLNAELKRQGAKWRVRDVGRSHVGFLNVSATE